MRATSTRQPVPTEKPSSRRGIRTAATVAAIAVAALVALALASSASAATFSLYGTFWDTDRLDDTLGGGVGVAFPLGTRNVDLEFRASYLQELNDDPLDAVFDDDEDVFQETSVELIPIDAGVRFNLQPFNVFNPYLGVGGTYYLLDTTRRNSDVDDEVGYYGMVGSRFGDDDGASFFVEALYRKVEATVVEDDPDDFDLDNEVSLDLDGFSLQAGIRWTF